MRQLPKICSLVVLSLLPFVSNATERRPIDSKFIAQNKVIDVVVTHRFTVDGVGEKADEPLTAESCSIKAEQNGDNGRNAYVFEYIEEISPSSQAALLNLVGKNFTSRLVQLCVVRD